MVEDTAETWLELGNREGGSIYPIQDRSNGQDYKISSTIPRNLL